LVYLIKRKVATTMPNSFQTLFRRYGKKTLGPNHPDVAESLNALALLYTQQGRHDDAEQLFKRSLAIRERLSVPMIVTSRSR
jgi:hypothetical protein